MSDLATFPVPGVHPGGGARTRALRAVVAAIRPRGHGFDQPIDDDVVRDVEDGLRHAPRALRTWVTLGLYAVEFGVPLYGFRLRRFSGLAPEEGLALLQRWENARGLRHALLRGLRFLIYFSFYQHPQVLRSLDVDWEGRARTLVRLRAELLAGAARPGTDGGGHG